MQKELPAEFLKRMEAQLGEAFPAYLEAMGRPALRGLRVNPLRIGPEAFLGLSPWRLRPSGVLPEGFVLEEAGEGIGAHPYHMAGLFYMQEPSAMGAVALADPKPGMRVLDLCAAPGGKAGGMGARMAGEGLLVANEIVPGRARILLENLQRLGIQNAVVTNSHPEKLCEALRDCFDLVLVDAPCSGEGMFRKDPEAVQEWSPAHVRACAERQRAILASAAKAVASGGALVYSTCTFSPEENEGTVEGFLEGHGDFTLEGMARIYPQSGLGEGHFMARLRRQGGSRREYPPLEFLPYRPPVDAPADLGEAKLLKDGRVQLLPPMPLPKPLAGLRILSAGVAAGEAKDGRFIPAHALAMAREWERQLCLDISDPRLGAFLHGEAIPVEGSLRGFVRLTLPGGYPLGFGKAVDGMLKNHLPKNLRI